MQKYRPATHSEVEEYVQTTMGKFTRNQIKKSAALMDILTDWIICVTNSIGLIHVEEKILAGEMVENPFRSTLREKESETKQKPRKR